MSGRVFFDTNVLIYADDQADAARAVKAQELIAAALRSSTGVISTQVLQEYFVVATRKLGVAPAVARRKVELFANLEVVVVDLAVILAAIDLHRLHAISFWDALIVQAAAAAGCATLLTQDLQHGQVLQGVRITDPFAA